MKRNRGSALIVALVVVIIAVGIGGAFLADTVFRTKMQNYAVESDVAQMIVDAALEKVRRALWVYKTNGTYPWDQILAAHASLSTNADEHLADYVAKREAGQFQYYYYMYYQPGVNTANEAPLPGDTNHFLGVTQPFAEGGFYCVVKDNDDGDGNTVVDADNQVLVYVTASLPDGTQRQIVAMVQYSSPTYTPDDAIIVDGSILFNGTPNVTGAKGSAHANGDITMSGNPSFSVSANATGVINEGTAPVPPQGFNEGVAAIVVPDVEPATYKSMADYVLQADGTIKVVSTGQIITPGGQGWNGWKWSAAGMEWSLSGNSVPPSGTYYAESNVKISGSGNVPSRTMSVVAEKCIETTGNVMLTPVLTGTLFLAGGDIKLGGTAGASFMGLVAAKEQIKTMGTFTHQGVLLAKNAQDTYSLVTAGSTVDPDSQFGGTMTVNYEGGLQTVLVNPTSAVAVKNVRRIK